MKRWHQSQATDYHAANVELRQTTEALVRLRLPLDASDHDLCEAAATLAARCAGRAEIFHSIDALRAAMERICEGQGVAPPPAKVKDRCAVARMTCTLWWRRKLRQHHGRMLEAAAIRLGLVSKARDLYVSNEGLQARLQQNSRNAAAMEATIARNELGQEFTLAELAAKGTANKRIRRAELMTRIAGFERVAKAAGHAGLFLTLTCPSRFHRFRTVNGGRIVIPNPNYQASENPRTGQKYLAAIWSHMRADLKRRGIGVYGFRIAEPQHDGTPHWHFLLFCANEHAPLVESVFTKHALKDSPDEPGAREHRCDLKRIDWNKGSAAGYVAKYVSKNIDGEHVGEDLNGGEATKTAVRVEAWAARWGIRQFQQVGGPPVGVWRELRRIESIPAHAPQYLQDAHEAANKKAAVDGREGSSAAWDRYCNAQGGVFCGRDARIKLAMKSSEKLGRYGDEAAPRPYGVETSELEACELQGGSADSHRRAHWIVESARQQWEILRKPAAAPAWSSFAEGAEPAQPWTRVNNCTEIVIPEEGPVPPSLVESGLVNHGVTCDSDPHTAARWPEHERPNDHEPESSHSQRIRIPAADRRSADCRRKLF